MARPAQGIMGTRPAERRLRRDGVKLRVACFVIAAVACLSPAALGVPTLQLYIPGSTWDPVTQTWVIVANEFDLMVIGAKSPENIHIIENLTLLVAEPNWDAGAEFTISTVTDNPNDNNPLAAASMTFDHSDLALGGAVGSPNDTSTIFDEINFPDHGIYPSRFWAVDLSQFLFPDTSNSFLDVENAGETVVDYNPGADPGTDQGDVQYYRITYSPFNPNFFLHLDLIGFATNGFAKWTFAPFSHDAEASGVPEPTTMALLGMALLGLGVGRARKRRSRS